MPRSYHERTKHSPESVRLESRRLDWRNRPDPLKRYVDIEAIPLPEPGRTGVPWHVAVGASEPDGGAELTAEALSYALFHAAGVTRSVDTLDGELHFRTYASAGALYPNEVYVVTGDLDGLEAGVYHYAPEAHALVPLRLGDHRGNVELAGARPGAATVIISGIPWRTAWKYGARGFRHLSWDAGMVIANLLAAAAARDVPARVLLGFVDDAVNELLGVDGQTEFALCAAPLGAGDAPAPRQLDALGLRVAPLSPRPERDPLIGEAHAEMVLSSEADVERFRKTPSEPRIDVDDDDARVVEPAAQLGDDPVEDVVMRRGSSRRQALDPFPAGEYAAILDLALSDVPRDWSGATPSAFVIANALEGLPPGAHRYGRGGRFEPVREGDFRKKAAFICLEQRLGGEAATTTFLMADLGRAVDVLGERGYAAAQLEAAIVAGRMYLGAYGQCLGASGITYYDDEARRFFETEREPMLAVVMGPEGERRSIVRCRRDLAAR